MNQIQQIGVGQTPQSTTQAVLTWLAVSTVLIGGTVAGFSYLESRKSSDKYHSNPIITYENYCNKIIDRLVSDHGFTRKMASWLLSMPSGETGNELSLDLYKMKIPSIQAARYIVHLSELRK